MTRTKAILDSALCGIITIDQRGTIESFNLTAEHIFGYTSDEVLGRNISLLMPSPYSEEHDGYIAAYIQTGQAKIIGKGRQVLGLRKDGTTFPMNLGISESRMGSLRFFTAVLTDITTVKKVLADLSESEAFAHAVLNSMSAEIAVLDREGRIVAVNEAWRRISEQGEDDWDGHGRNTHVGLNYLQVCRVSVGKNSEGAKEAHDGILAVLEGRVPSFNLEYPCLIKGKLRWFTMNVTPLGGERGGVVVSHTDISERKWAEDSVRESEERLSLVLEAAKIGTWDWDLRTDNIYASPRFMALFGLPSCANWNFEGFMEVLYPEDRESVSLAIATALEGREDYQVEMRTVWPDGSLHWVASRGRVYFDAAGQPVRMSGAALDLTENKRVERQLRERQMEAENYMRLCVANQTIAAIAHELNQPLNAIASYSAGAVRLIKAGNPPLEKLSKALEQNAKQALRAGQVIRELLDFLRGNETTKEMFDLNQIIRQTVNQMQKDGLLDQFKTTLELADTLPPVQANRIQVEKALVNLLRNSIEAMSGPGLENARLWVIAGTAGQDGFAQVTVRDSGPGLTEESIKLVFDPFYTTKPRGLGMGLAISRALIEAQGGELWAEQSEGNGAVFHFSLPVALESAS